MGKALFPIPVFDWVVECVLGIYKTMEHFVGHESS